MTTDFVQRKSLWLGVAYAISTAFMIAVMNVLAKLLSEHNFHAAEIVFYRNLFGIFIIGAIALGWSKSTRLFKTKRPKDHLLRGILGTAGVAFIFAAYAYLPLTTGTVLIFTSSLMIPVLGSIFLKENVSIYRWTAVISGFIGILIMTGFAGEMNPVGVACGLVGAFLNACVMVSLRSLAKTEHPLTTSFYFMVTGLILTAPLMPFLAGGHLGEDIWPYLFALAIFGSFSHITKNAIYLHLPAALAAPFPYTALVWAALFDFTIWGYIPEWSIIAGGAIVIISNLFIIYREHKAAGQLAARRNVIS